jgi:hypothetical protein
MRSSSLRLAACMARSHVRQNVCLNVVETTVLKIRSRQQRNHVKLGVCDCQATACYSFVLRSLFTFHPFSDWAPGRSRWHALACVSHDRPIWWAQLWYCDCTTFKRGYLRHTEDDTNGFSRRRPRLPEEHVLGFPSSCTRACRRAKYGSALFLHLRLARNNMHATPSNTLCRLYVCCNGRRLSQRKKAARRIEYHVGSGTDNVGWIGSGMEELEWKENDLRVREERERKM